MPKQDDQRSVRIVRARVRQVLRRKRVEVVNIGQVIVNLTMRVDMSKNTGDRFSNIKNSQNLGRGQKNKGNRQTVKQSASAAKLLNDLESLRTALFKEANTVERQQALGHVAAAQVAAEKGDEKTAWKNIKAISGAAAKWAGDVAAKVGADAISKAITGG